MSLAPHPQDTAPLRAIQEIDLAMGELALWCPHGLDSRRIGDYHSAERARELLQEARIILAAAITPLIPPNPWEEPA